VQKARRPREAGEGEGQRLGWKGTSTRAEALDILAGAVLRLVASGWHPGLGEGAAAAGAEGLLQNARRAACSETLLSTPHRASMSGPGGAQTPPAKEDEHG
jgi:hypothetical protein